MTEWWENPNHHPRLATAAHECPFSEPLPVYEDVTTDPPGLEALAWLPLIAASFVIGWIAGEVVVLIERHRRNHART